MIKRILVGLGGTPFTKTAIQRSVELAKLHDAELTGITIVNPDQLSNAGLVPTGPGAHAPKLRDRRIEKMQKCIQEAVENFESRCKENEIRYRTRIERGDPFDLMVSTARYHDLMIFGLKSLFDYGMANRPRETLCRLVEEGVGPIIAVTPHFRKIKKVLIAYSGSMESAEAMKRFIRLRLWPDMKIRIICCKNRKEEAEKLLSEAREYCEAHGFRGDYRALTGSAKTQILKHMKAWDADLVVMGNSARSLFLKRVLGAVKIHVIRNADRPLFLSQ